MKFKTLCEKELDLPVFFPDATRAVIRTLDSQDIENTCTPGVLVNTYHLYRELGKRVIKHFGGVRPFMNWKGSVISDSGGFQVMSIAKNTGGKVTDEGVIFKPQNSKKIKLTPEDSIDFQLLLKTDMVVVLDDFTPPGVDRDTAAETVDRTILWAKRSKEEFEKQCDKLKLKKRPYLLGVVQGGDYQDLRAECAQRLAEIGFDGFGYGGWPLRQAQDKLGTEFDYESAKTIIDNTPPNYLLYGLGIGKPNEVVNLAKMGYHIFDCVLPTRDGRHKRLYVYNASSINKIDVNQPNFYSYYVPDKQKYFYDTSPVSTACDCHLCKNYSRAYLAHLFRIEEMTALRLATIHNLRFYSILMEKLQQI